MSERVLRVGAIGAGNHALGTVWPLLASNGLLLHAVTSQSLEKARSAAARFGVAHAFDDAATMVDSVDLDALIIVVAPHAYGPQVRLAAERGLPAFLEKPGAGSFAEAESLVAVVEAAGLPIVVGYQKRFAGAYRRARAIIEAPDFGPISLLSFTWAMGPFGGRFSLRDWIFENPVHHFDLARYLAGEIDDLEVHASGQGNEYAIVATGRAASGALVTIRANTTASWQQHNESLEAFGLGHTVWVDNMDTLIHRPPEPPERRWVPNYTVPAAANFSGQVLGYGTELRHFRDVVVDGVENQSNLANAGSTLRLTDRIATAAEAHFVRS
jgi:predicted dehydrogenase